MCGGLFAKRAAIGREPRIRVDSLPVFNFGPLLASLPLSPVARCDRGQLKELGRQERFAAAAGRAGNIPGWLWEAVLLNLAKKASQPILVVTCGWEYPSSPALQPFSTNDELDDFDLLRIKEYLQARGIISPEAFAHESLVSALYDLTIGHPLVLALAVTYIQTLDESERTPESLRTHQPLLSEEARVQWLEERLLNRLPEPYRTLLERGPILRNFDQAALQVLLRAGNDERTGERVLDDRTYARFLQYPFINRKTTLGDALLEQPTFHDLTRRVRLEALRRWHPDTRQRLHRMMADYYRGLLKQNNSQTQYHKPSHISTLMRSGLLRYQSSIFVRSWSGSIMPSRSRKCKLRRLNDGTT